MDLAGFAFGVVATKVSRVCVRLIDVCVGGSRFTFEFDNHDAFTQEEYRVGTPRLQR